MKPTIYLDEVIEGAVVMLADWIYGGCKDGDK